MQSLQPARQLILGVRPRRGCKDVWDLMNEQSNDVHSTWIDAVNAGDLDRLLSLMADDVVFLAPGRAPFGRDGFSDVFSAAHQQFRIRCVSELKEVVVGEVAYTLSRDSLSVTPRTGGEA